MPRLNRKKKGGSLLNYQLIKRNVEATVIDTLSDTPVTVIQGARQVGKSTLASMVSANILHKSITLDSDTALAAAKENPYEFISQFQEGLLIIDEIQRCPELLSAIKLSVDSDRRPGRFLITGSANILNLKGTNESLAGRAETIKLEPFSIGEINGVKEDFISMLMNDNALHHMQNKKPYTRAEYAQLIEKGGYPGVQDRDSKRRNAFFKNYISRVLDHDANELSGLAHLDKIKTIYRYFASIPSQEYVRANVSRIMQIPESSMTGYVKLLEDLGLIHLLSAWGKNISKRALSRPKIVLSDTGLVCSLNGTSSKLIADIENGNELGPLLETCVINEVIKQQSWSKIDFTVFHYRDKDNREADLIIEISGGKVIALEVKAASSFTSKDFAGLKVLRNILGDRFHCGILLYTGTDVQPFGDKLFVAPVSSIWQ